MRRLTPILFVLLTLSSPLAAAHTFWVESQPARDGSTALLLYVGHHLGDRERVELGSMTRYARIAAYADGVEVPLEASAFRLRGHPNVVIPPSTQDAKPGPVRMVIVDSTRRESTLLPAKFDAYLKEEHLLDVLARRHALGEAKRSGREQYFRCAKAISRGTKPAAWVSRPVGQELELVPGVDPSAAPKGASVSFVVLLHGKPLAGRTVSSSHLRGGKLQLETAVTDAEGQVSFEAPAAPWLVSLVHMDRSDDPLFDWRSVWGTLWIDRPQQ